MCGSMLLWVLPSIGEVFLNLLPRSLLVSVLDVFQKPRWNSMASPLLRPSVSSRLSLRNQQRNVAWNVMFGREGGFCFSPISTFSYFYERSLPFFLPNVMPLALSRHFIISLAVFKDIIIRFGGHCFFTALIGSFQYYIPWWIAVNTLLALAALVLFDWSAFFFLAFKWIILAF